MAIIGPRPLLVRYLARYNEEQHHRHDVRPGLTGYAQAHGRNAVSWEDKFAMDGRIKNVVVGGKDSWIMLTKALLNDNRIDDLKRALEDPAFRQKLLEEYGID